MNAAQKRYLLWGAITAILAVAVLSAFAPRPVAVDLVTVEPAPMTVTINAEGTTRVSDVFVLSAPVGGRVRRIDAHVGDPVVAGETVLAQIEPVDPGFLDSRSEAQAEAAVQAAESALELAGAEVDEARAELDFATTEQDRARALIAEGTITRRELEAAERAFKTARAAFATAEAALQMRNAELTRARAQLVSPAGERGERPPCDCVLVKAPVDGRVLRVFEASERVVAPGEALVELGDPASLEIVTDYLSTDAVLIEAGDAVIIDAWGGADPLAGVVRRVEPFGYTKVSALGIDEQRVNVVIDFTSPFEQWQRLGHGYQVETRVVRWESAATLSVPLTALFRHEGVWSLFVERGGRAQLRSVTLGQRNGLRAEVLDGLQAGDRVVAHPSNRIADAVRIAARAPAETLR